MNKRKFDIRIWVFLSHELEIFFFKEGYIRTSSQPYSMDAAKLDDDFIHLTNNAVQKHSKDYGQHEDGNQLSFADFKKFMQDQPTSVDFDTDVLPKMKYISALTLTTVKKKINANKRK